MSEFKNLLLDVEDEIAVLTINRLTKKEMLSNLS